MTDNFQLHLSATQMTKLRKQMPFQVSHGALTGESKTHVANIMLTPAGDKKITSALRRKKGVRINPKTDLTEVMDGGKLRIGRAFKKANIGFNKGISNLNPIAPILKDKKASKFLNDTGKVTHDYILPAVSDAGKPLYYGSAALGSTLLTGNPVAGTVAAQALYEYGGGKENDPSRNQKSKTLGMVSKKAGQLGTKALLKGAGAKNILNKISNPNPIVKKIGDIEGSVHNVAKVGGKFLQKGSQEAKDYMKKLREMRGGSFR